MSEHESSGIDMHKLLVEIDEEVRSKRASGELPADLERELDMVFARFAPAGAVDGDFDQLLARMEQQSFVDLIAPNESVRPGVPHIKRVVQKTIRWYLRYVVEQYSGFAHTSTKALRKIADRLTAVEQLAVSVDDVVAAGRVERDPSFDKRVLKSLAGIKGRVLHTHAGSGDLVEKMVDAGLDAYGVEPSPTGGGVTSLDIRHDDERSHLRSLAPGAIDGLVLTGSVETLPPGAQVELIDLAAVAVAQGGRVVIVTATPEGWSSGRSPVVADLAPGRPLHADTWTHLLEDRGFKVESVEYSPTAGRLHHVPGTDETSAAMNANLDVLNETLFPPSSAIVIAHR